MPGGHREPSETLVRRTTYCNTNTKCKLYAICKPRTKLQLADGTGTEQLMKNSVETGTYRLRVDLQTQCPGTKPTPRAAQRAPPVGLETTHAPARAAVMRRV